MGLVKKVSCGRDSLQEKSGGGDAGGGLIFLGVVDFMKPPLGTAPTTGDWEERCIGETKTCCMRVNSISSFHLSPKKTREERGDWNRRRRKGGP